MDAQANQMINSLFAKLKQAETQSGPREAEAEAQIRDALAAQPNAPYYMAQAILVQEHALNSLNQRVQELEQALAQRPASGGGFLGGLFGAGNQTPAAPQRQAAPAAQNAPFRNAPSGSFLGGAMQTAMGVAGGVLLANAIGDMFAGDVAEAATVVESLPEEAAAELDAAASDWDADMGMGEDEF